MLLLAVALACVENALTGARTAVPLEATTITVLSPVYNETLTVTLGFYRRQLGICRYCFAPLN
jgi:hypothetical protein